MSWSSARRRAIFQAVPIAKKTLPMSPSRFRPAAGLQSNAIARSISWGGNYDLVVFFDDDFVAAKDFLEGAERLFKENPDIVAASGHLLADGYRTAGITFTEADQLVAGYEQNGFASLCQRSRISRAPMAAI